jgi:fibronectin-binding autotransporter adhesin
MRRISMKRLALVAVTIVGFGVAGCGSSNNPNTPSDTTIFTVQLSPLNEVPAITGAEASARGTAVITINKATNTVDFNVSLNSFPTASVLTAAHIHPGAVGINGSPLVNTGLTSATAPSLSSGAATFSVSVPTTAENVTNILAAPQNFYFNVHTTANGGGVMRGQLR